MGLHNNEHFHLGTTTFTWLGCIEEERWFDSKSIKGIYCQQTTYCLDLLATHTKGNVIMISFSCELGCV